MANSEISHLITMANDIAANLGFEDEAEGRIADHINRFWAPRMRKLLIEYAANQSDGLSDSLLAALDKIRS